MPLSFLKTNPINQTQNSKTQKFSDTMKTYKYNKLVIVIEPTSTGYSAYIPELEGIASVGDTLQEVSENIKEAVDLYFEDLRETEGIDIDTNFKYEFQLSIEAFFNLFKSINVSALADKAGINASLLRQYANGLKHPSLKQAYKIQEAIHKLGNELNSVNFIV